MLSRVAERVYWMSRYLERTENTARLLSVHTSLLMDMPITMEINWFTLVKIFNGDDLFYQQYERPDEGSVMQFLIADKQHYSSLYCSLEHIRENVRTSLDVLPEEIWEQVNQAHLLIERDLDILMQNRHRRQQLLRRLIQHCQCMRGILDSHLSRGHVFDFEQIGKHLERADMNSRILEMTSLLLSDARSDAVRKYEGILWTTLLQAVGAHQMYLQDVHPPVTARKVLNFLVHDARFPRSLSYSLNSVAYYVRNLQDNDVVLTMLQRISDHLESQNMEHVPADEWHVLMDYLQVQFDLLHIELDNRWFHPRLDAIPVMS